MPIDKLSRQGKTPIFYIRNKDVEVSMQAASVEMKIDGKTVPQSAVESLALEQVLADHSLLAVELRRKSGLETVFGSTLEANVKSWVSKTVSLKISASDKSAGDSGEVNFIGVIVSAIMGSVVGSLGNIYLRCLSPTIMLDINRVYRTWCESSSRDIINGLLSDEAMPNVKISVSGETTLPGFLAYGQTPLEIINYLAGFEGWWAYYDGMNYNVTKDLPDTSIELKANQVGAFVLTADAVSMKKFAGRDFEYGKGQWFQSQSSTPPGSGHPLGKAVGSASQISGSKEFLRLRHMPLSQGDLDKRLKIALGGSFARTLGCNGLTDRFGVMVGKVLKLKWEGQRRQTESRREEELSGQYLITGAEHRYEDGQYRCEFKGVDRTLAFPYFKELNFPEHLLETAEVTDVDDPEKLGRIKVRFGWSSSGGEVESPWIRASQLQAGATPHGTWFIPEVGDSVLVSIGGPHLERAMAIGSVYDGSRLPRNDLSTKDNNFKSIYTRSGNEITFSDENGKEKITMATKDGAASIVFDAASGSEKLSLTAKKDAASVVLDGSKKVTISAGGSSCQVSLDGSGALKLEAQKSITLKAQEIKLEGNASVDIKSSAKLTHKAGMMDIDGGGILNIKGGIIKIN